MEKLIHCWRVQMRSVLIWTSWNKRYEKNEKILNGNILNAESLKEIESLNFWSPDHEDEDEIERKKFTFIIF